MTLFSLEKNLIICHQVDLREREREKKKTEALQIIVLLLPTIFRNKILEKQPLLLFEMDTTFKSYYQIHELNFWFDYIIANNGPNQWMKLKMPELYFRLGQILNKISLISLYIYMCYVCLAAACHWHCD